MSTLCGISCAFTHFRQICPLTHRIAHKRYVGDCIVVLDITDVLLTTYSKNPFSTRQPRFLHDKSNDARLENVNVEISPRHLMSLNIHAKYKHWIPKLLQAMEICFNVWISLIFVALGKLSLKSSRSFLDRWKNYFKGSAKTLKECLKMFFWMWQILHNLHI